ncbi:MAG: divalent-cation tolerance protein CutA [Nanoarchaeota archaeon]
MKNTMSAIAIYTTCKDEKEAKHIANLLLEKKLIACANATQHKSFYTWKGKQHEEKETVMIMKSRKELFPKIAEEIKRAHSYELPCIVYWDIEGTSDYINWITEETEK